MVIAFKSFQDRRELARFNKDLQEVKFDTVCLLYIHLDCLEAFSCGACPIALKEICLELYCLDCKDKSRQYSIATFGSKQ